MRSARRACPPIRQRLRPVSNRLRNRASSLRSRNTGRKERRSAQVPERQPCSMLHSPGSRRLLGRLVGVRRHLGAGHELIIKRYHSRKPHSGCKRTKYRLRGFHQRVTHGPHHTLAGGCAHQASATRPPANVPLSAGSSSEQLEGSVHSRVPTRLRNLCYDECEGEDS